MQTLLNRLYSLGLFFAIIGFLVFIVDFGFSQSEKAQQIINKFYFLVLAIGLFTILLRYITERGRLKRKALIFDVLNILLIAFLFYLHFFCSGKNKIPAICFNFNWVRLVVILNLVRQAAEVKFDYKRTVLNPAQLFIVSFFVLILLGSFLLMLPKCTYKGLHFLDALFTSTSAVCVTGLSVVDTATYFTPLGQTVLMLLIQAGGLGILTFASYFSYFFKGGSTYGNQLALSDMTSSRKMGEVFSTLKYIILITFLVELFAGLLIYFSSEAQYFTSFYKRVFFSAFHSVSAFCNAGFSNLPDGLQNKSYQYNYPFQLIIIFTFVLGGLGFPIVANIFSFIRYKLKTFFTFSVQKKHHRPWVLSLNSRITLVTTISITIIAFILFYILEYSNSLREHHGLGKIVSALFGATTPRTAGFNTFDFSRLSFPGFMLLLLLMWIGASPASTGGGIKTSTFAIATLNILSLARGKSRIEVYRRQIADVSVRRAFAIISLSLIVIGTGVATLVVTEGESNLKGLVFECFSAYSTVGLSLGITPGLSAAGKFIVITLMFIGRISMLSVIIAIFRKSRYKNYNYPTEEILMN